MKNFNMVLFLLSLSPWPIFLSLSLMFMSVNLITFMHFNESLIVMMNFLLILLIMYCWWNDVIIESNKMGFHNNYIMIMMMYSMIMFIISEIFFFISFFWTFFNSMISPEIWIGAMWPSSGILSMNYMDLPLMNSLLLISSGCSITWSHMKLIYGNYSHSVLSLMLTILLGMMFIICQFIEYNFSYFSFSDSIFGSIFFISTGFHGIHVIIGTLFLIFMLLRMMNLHFSKIHMLGYEFSIWYWHFVDVVWLYLYMMVYWLGM